MGKHFHGRPKEWRKASAKRNAIAVLKAPAFWIALAVVFLVAVFVRHQFALNDELIREEAATAQLERRSPDSAWDPSWPPLPNSGQVAARPVEQVRAAYAFAARRADILQYIPCYCGCESEGHRSNEDCYLRGRTSAGTPQWSAHSEMCAICLGVTRDVIKLHAEGQSVGEIRQAVDASYVPRYGHGTPTPPPPEK
jgi:hypothetical protein